MTIEKFIFLPTRETLPATHKPLLDKAVEILTGEKNAKTTSEDAAVRTLKGGLTQAMKAPKKTVNNKVHNALWDYEKAHLASRSNWAVTKQKLQNAFVSDPQFANKHIAVSDFIDDANDRGMAQIEGLVSGVIRKLGTVFLGDTRFTDLRPQPTAASKGKLKNKVYVLGRIVQEKGAFHGGARLEQDPSHTDQHFVYLPNSKTYVRRYVMRGLNHNDAINIGNGASLAAPVLSANAQRNELKSDKKPTRHVAREGTPLNTSQKILSHTRGWQKRYISTGVSKRPAYSTQGATFISVHGTAIIDLAMVDLTMVFDIHSPKAVTNVMTWNSTNVTTAPGPGNNARTFAGEEFLALRDVLRTRELLIEGTVPVAAVRYSSKGLCTAGLGCDKFGEPETLLRTVLQSKWAADVKCHEACRYPSVNGKYWLFLKFADAATVNRFLHPTTGFAGTHAESMKLNQYEHPATLGGWT